jgi:catechol 2,3-dioxygenase-like lactoylglutathione lyase family enzyme
MPRLLRTPLGFTVGFESSWIAYLTTDDGSASIAFMAPDHPSAPPGPETYSGAGICFELQVEDAATAFQELATNGLEVGYPLTDEPFGQRRFGFYDPAGVWIDVVEQIEPAPGFWDRYPSGMGRGVR